MRDRETNGCCVARSRRSSLARRLAGVVLVTAVCPIEAIAQVPAENPEVVVGSVVSSDGALQRTQRIAAELRAVYEALDESPDRRIYVLVALKQPAHSSTDDPYRRRIRVAAWERRVLDTIEPDHFEAVYVYQTFAGLTGWATQEGVAALAAHPDVLSVGLDARSEPTAISSQARGYIGADRLHEESGVTGEGVTIAVIGSGVDVGFPDLEGSIAEGAWHFLDQGGDQGPGAPDSSGHETLVAAVITSDGIEGPKGIAPGADILPIKVSGNVSDTVAGIDYAVARKDSYANLAAINLSLGGGSYTACPCDDVDTRTRVYSAAVSAALEAGISTFASSGNGSNCNALLAPACVSGATSVAAAYDESGTFRIFGCTVVGEAGAITCFSNRGPCLDLRTSRMN